MHRNVRMMAAGIGSSTVLAFAAAPAMAADATHAPAPHVVRAAQERGLLDGLLGGLLGGTTSKPSSPVPTNVVTGLVNSVLSLPGGNALGTSAVTNLVNSVLGAGVTPDANVVNNLLGGVVGAVGGAGTNPADAVTGLVGGLLGQGVGLTSLTDTVNSVLGGAGASPLGLGQVTGIVNGLLASGLPTDPSGLLSVVTGLTSGLGATGTLLSPVTGLLDTLAGNAALPQPLRDLVSQLSGAVKSVGDGTVPDELSRTVGGLLGILGSNDSVAKPVQDILGQLSGLLLGSNTSAKPGTATGTAGTKYILVPDSKSPTGTRKIALSSMRARISRVAVNRKRNVATATVACPEIAVLGCDVRLNPILQSKVAGTQKRVVLATGATQKVNLALGSSSAKRARKGGRLAVRALTVIAGRSYSASRMVQLGRTR